MYNFAQVASALEKPVLAMLMMSNMDALDDCIELGLNAHCFSGGNVAVFNAILSLRKRNLAADEMMVCDALSELENSFRLVNDIMNTAQTPALLKSYCVRLILKYKKSRLMSILALSVERLKEIDDDELSDELDTIQAEVMDFSIRKDECIYEAKDVLQTVLGEINESIKTKEVTYLKTGLMELDKVLTGYDKKEMITIAGRPGTGKTAILLSSMLEILSSPKPTPILLFTFEMSKEQIVKRLVCMISGVNSRDLEKGLITQRQSELLKEASEIIARMPLYIVEDSALKIEGIKRIARRYKRSKGVGLIAIDYLQLIKASEKGMGSTERVSHISTQTKSMANELDAPVVILAQLNREVEREQRDPRVSDLRDSGAIEQDSDKIVLLSPLEDAKTIAKVKVIVGKYRNGEIGNTTMLFNKQITRYVNDGSFRKETSSHTVQNEFF